MNVLSLFAGIGGLELGLERAGMTVVGQVERDPFCQQVLTKHWPKAPKHDDVNTTIEWWRSRSRPHVDLVAGGFPCQPVSLIGKGLAQDDERWLWPAMADVIDALRPEWVLFENVPGLRTRGLHIVTGDLEGLGYTVEVRTLSACAVGAPFMRRRLFGVAHAPRIRRGTGRPGGPTGETPLRGNKPSQGMGHQPAEARRAAGHWASEPGVGRLVDGVPRWVAERHLRAYGNAVVPAVAEHIGRLIVNAGMESAA